MKLLILFLQYDTKKYPNSLEKLRTILGKVNISKEYIIIDNANEKRVDEKFFGDTTVIGGDNSSWEFSGWDRGLRYAKENGIDYDVVLFVNDAFLVNGWTLLDRAREFDLAGISLEKKAAVGHVDTKGYQMDLMGQDVSKWICSNAFFLPREIIESIGGMVSIDNNKLREFLPEEFLDELFLKNANVGDSYKNMAIKWLTEEWHSKIEIKKETWPFFRKKMQALFNESLLTSRIKGAGFQVIPYFDIKDKYEIKQEKNFVFLFYQYRIKKFIPKKVFLFTNLCLDLYHRLKTSFAIRMVKKYFNLAALAVEEFRVAGISGLIFAIKRHFKKRRGELISSYAVKNDYEKDLITIVIIAKRNDNFIMSCLKSIQENASKKYGFEVLIGSDGATQRNIKKFFKKYNNFRFLSLKKGIFSKNSSTIVKIFAKGEYLVFLDSSAVVGDNWLNELIEPLRDKKIGAVGGKVLDREGNILSAGIEFDKDGGLLCEKIYEKKDTARFEFSAFVPVVSLDCLAIRHDVFNRFQFDQNIEDGFNQVDLCLNLGKSGYDVLYNPKVEIVCQKCLNPTPLKNIFEQKFLLQKHEKEISSIVSKVQRVAFNPDRYKDAMVIIRDDGLGDILMGVSAFKSLRENNSDKKLVFITYERNVEMISGFKLFDEVLPIPDGKKYSPIPIPTRSTKIYNFIDLEMHFGNFFAVTKESNKEHRHVTFMKEFGLNEPYEIVKMPEYSEAKANVLNMVRKMGYSIDSPFVVFNLTASNHARSWWYPYYKELAIEVQKMGFIPLVIGTRGEEYFEGSKFVSLVGKTKTITEYIEAIKLGKYVISTDTSAYHVAALSGIPFLAIFTGGVLPESRLCFYSKYEVVSPPSTLACYPCWDEGCKDLSIRHKKDPCRIIVRPEEVIEKFKALIKKYPVK